MLQQLDFNLRGIDDGACTVHKEPGHFYLMTVPTHKLWLSIGETESCCVLSISEIEPGIYHCGLNFNNDINHYTDFDTNHAYSRLYSDGTISKIIDGSYYSNTFDSYGVADNLEQIKAKYAEMIAGPNSIVIGITTITREDEPSSDGWRWCKWGAYIGTRQPQQDYLYDEPEIESVIVFQVYAVSPKQMTI